MELIASFANSQRYAEDSQFAFNFDDDDEPEKRGNVAFVNPEFTDFESVQLLDGHHSSSSLSRGSSLRGSRYLDIHPDDH